MAEPRIQYAKTSDGVSIAYWALGEGAPLVYMPIPPFSHIQLEWEIAECREWYLRLAKRHKLIRYDGRGSGLSDRVVNDYSIEGQGRDLQAVVDSVGVDRFAIMVASHSAPVGISYAAWNPARVSHLILWCAVARGHDYYTPQVEARLDILRKDWDLYTETTAHVLFGWSAGEPARRIAALIRDSITQEALLAEVAAARQFDATHLLDDLRVPALVLHRRQHPVLDVGVARGLASGIPGARLVLLEGASLAPYLGDTTAVVRAITEFLGEDESPESSVNAASGILRTVLFTDLVGHTEMMQRLGDAKGRDVLREHETITREVLKANGGTEVKTMGDGFMASFGSVTKAVECAVALQRAFAEREGEPLSVRVGLNAGEPIEEDGDLFGATVILASRIAAKADGGEILVADTVRGLCSGKGFLFADRGEFVAKGFEEPVRVYEVGWR